MIGGGGGGRGDRHTDQNNGSLRVYFIIQIPPVIDWPCSTGEECGATAEITQSLQIDLVLSDSHPCAMTCLISIQSFCIWWRCDVAKTHMAPKNAIFTQNLQWARPLHMQKVLKRYGFESDMCQWISSFNTNIWSFLVVDGKLSRSVSIRTACLHGDKESKIKSDQTTE